MRTTIYVIFYLAVYAIALCLIMYALYGFVSDLDFSPEKIQATTIHCAPKATIDTPKALIRYVTVNEYNVFKHIVVPEECSQISTDSLHQDPAQLYRHGDTLIIGLHFYKN